MNATWMDGWIDGWAAGEVNIQTGKTTDRQTKQTHTSPAGVYTSQAPPCKATCGGRTEN